MNLNYIADGALAIAILRDKVTPGTTFQDWVKAIQDELTELAFATDKPSQHVPSFTEKQEEAIDVMITILSFLAYEKVNIEDLLTEKLFYNQRRKD